MKYERKYEEIHKTTVQEAIRAENRQKAGVYMILNKVNGEKYVGSAGTNRINVRFRNEIIHRTGSKKVTAAVAKYGVENFSFYILEYYGGIVHKENLSAAHVKLKEMETRYISTLKPEYNEWEEGGRHTEETKDSQGNQAKGKKMGTEQRELLSKLAKLRKANEELRGRLSAQASKPVALYNKEGGEHSRYPGLRAMAKEWHCCTKTIKRVIAEGKVFRGIGVVKLEEKENP